MTTTHAPDAAGAETIAASIGPESTDRGPLGPEPTDRAPAALVADATGPDAVDPEDGEPVWSLASGDALPGGHLAWERLGTGIRCETWLAWSTELWCPAIVKLPRPHQLTHPRARRTLDREAAALLIGGHPGLPRLLSDGREDDIPHLALEYLDGTALEDELEDHGAMQPGEAALLGVGLLSALRILHRHGLAHLDLKPANLLLRAGLPVLIDFGSAREIGRLQPKGRPIGTAGYAAPDLEAGEPISAAMDLYGVGAVLHEALTGEPTFDPELDAEDRPAAPELPDEVPTALRDLIRSLLAPGPEARPSLADTLLTLAGCAAERPWPQWADRALSPSAGPLR